MSALRDLGHLGHLALAAGIDVTYTSWNNQPVSASDEAVFAALRALAPDLGIELDRIEDCAGALETLERETWKQVAPPVVIGWDGSLVVPFRVPAEADHEWEVAVTTEAGRIVKASGRLFDLPADGHAWPGRVVHCIRRATIFLEGENGYHSLRWKTAGSQGEAFAISAPTRAWGGPMSAGAVDDAGGHGRRWGVFAPVYGLASALSGQAGDLASLSRLFGAVGARGGRYIATLPILAAFLDEPCQFSPYSPASRLMWNEIYLDLAARSADAGMPAPIAPPIVEGTLIDYRAQYQWRRAALDPIAAHMFATRRAEIDAWAVQHGAYDYAAFRAIGEQHRTGWAAWPAPWRDATTFVDSYDAAVLVGADPARVVTHVVSQWAMQRQLEGLTSAQGSQGVGLYLDLPVGVNGDAYEVWRHRSLFITDLAAGAPPDALFLGGQDWGLPPLSPIGIRRDRYRYFIRCVQHHMRIASMLRIDHVMGLFRLYCVPSGRPATDGVYLRYQADELLAILSLESHRLKCSLVGEDLGTVPEHVRPSMQRHSLFRLHVGQWSLPMKPGQAPAKSPPAAVASLNTHDTATFAGWWRGADIDNRRDLDLITAAQEKAERVERDLQRVALLAFAATAFPSDPATVMFTDVERAMIAATTDLALGPAEVVLVALDDLALDPSPHNVPGTSSQRPNWQRRIDRWAEALDPHAASPAAAATITAVTTARPRRH
ncbi:4-alpha-glucanotransferase [soil metagenome]